ncbi:MAG: hypothetical protein ACRDK2_08135 [Solirubrobacteraceae bacterium]
MRRRRRNPWDLPTVRAFGSQLLELEEQDKHQSAIAHRHPGRRAAVAATGLAVVGLCVILILPGSHPAQAHNAVIEAPAAAERAGSLRFRSTLTIQVQGHAQPGVSEEGAIDFLTGAYVTATRFEADNDMREQRSINGILYTAPHARQGSEPTRWYSARVHKGVPGGFATQSDAFTDPPAVFRALAHIKARVRRTGTQRINGAPTTIYQLSTDLERFLAASAGHIQSLRMYRGVKATLLVWIDRQGRPVQVQETFRSESNLLSTIVRFSGYGQQVLVQPPPKSRVRPIQGTVLPNPLGMRPGLPGLLFFRASAAHAPR